MIPSAARKTVFLVALFAFGFATFVSANHSWGGYHWARQSNPFTLNVGNNLSTAWQPYLSDAITQWSASDVLDLVAVPGGTNPRNCRPTTGRIEACSAGYGYTGWLGIASIWLNGLHITQATTKLNDTYFKSATYNTPGWRHLVTCQEIAHDFGLDHQDTDFYNQNLGTCMDYTNDPDGTGANGPLNNWGPNQHDYDELDIIYSHLDSTTTVGALALPQAMPPGVGFVLPDTPAQWGRLIRSSANGRVQVFELDFGGGNRILTEVFWADPAGDARR